MHVVSADWSRGVSRIPDPGRSSTACPHPCACHPRSHASMSWSVSRTPIYGQLRGERINAYVSTGGLSHNKSVTPGNTTSADEPDPAAVFARPPGPCGPRREPGLLRGHTHQVTGNRLPWCENCKQPARQQLTCHNRRCTPPASAAQHRPWSRAAPRVCQTLRCCRIRSDSSRESGLLERRAASICNGCSRSVTRLDFTADASIRAFRPIRTPWSTSPWRR